MPQPVEKAASHKFGTFGGVFTPSILTIFGVIMFMRANFVTGHAGIVNAVLILLLCQFITLITTLSVAAISTNIPVKGGGAYFMVSRVIGPEYGGAIGITLFLAQVVSISFYLLGFAEAVVRAFPAFAPYFLEIGLTATAVLFVIALIGADLAIKAQYFIMAILFSSIFVFLGGAATNFMPETLAANWEPAKDPASYFGFWGLYAIYFPSVTGFIAGINMSGDLKNPGKSMTRGTLYALLVSSVVYFLQIIFYGGGFERSVLINDPFGTMVNNALGGASFMVIAGVYASTLSSALGRFVGAPRILQAISVDEILPFLKPFGKGYGNNNEPRLALFLCGISTVILLYLGGDGSGGAFLNSIATIMGMFFLYTFGLLNYAAFVEGYSGNPSFRPRFKFFHWSIALLGFILSIGSALLVDFYSAAAALLILIALIAFLKTRKMQISFGDVRRGFLFTKVRNNLFYLKEYEDDVRNWRPSILTLSGNPATRETLVSYAVWMSANRGLVTLCSIVKNSLEEGFTKKRIAERQLEKFLEERNIQAFSHVVFDEDFLSGAKTLLQGNSFGPIKPNVIVFGWPGAAQGIDNLLQIAHYASCLQIDQAIIIDKGLPGSSAAKRIDVWWRGRKNGALMLILAHLLSLNWEWTNTEIRLIRLIDDEAGNKPSLKALKRLIKEARIHATAKVIVSEEPFAQVLRETSENSTAVFLGFETFAEQDNENWFYSYRNLTQNLPTTLFVRATSETNYIE